MAPTSESPPVRLEAIATQFGLADIYVFGSRAGEIATGAPHADTAAQTDSDVDIAVRPVRDRLLTPAERVELTLALEHALGVKQVDLLVVTEAGPFLALAVIRGNLLYRADPVDQAEYELFILRRAGDLAPLERERRELVLRGGGR